MRPLHTALLSAACLLPISAHADGALAYVDAYYVPQAEIDTDDDQPTLDGDGYGIKGALSFGGGLFLAGEYQEIDYDEDNSQDFDADGENDRISTDIEEFRVGAGLRQRIGGSTLAFVQGDYISLDSETDIVLATGDSAGGSDSEDGYGVHAGLRGESGGLGVTARVGYIDLGEVDGIEYELEADYQLFDALGLFANYRLSDLSGDEADLESSLIRVGATVYLGSSGN